MLSKIITFLAVFVLLFLLQGVSQSTESSAHPLLDKYYPRPENNTDTNTTVNSQIKPIPQTNPEPSLANTPAIKNTPIVPAGPVATTIHANVYAPESANLPAENTAPPATTARALSNMPAASNIAAENEIPALASKPEISNSIPEKNEPVETTTHSLSNLSKMTDLRADSTLPVFATAPVIRNRITVTKPVPATKNDQISFPPSQSLYDIRLGSSTPQYDTWVKNNNGAGSVTTSPK
jgi:hypothetical protein